MVGRAQIEFAYELRDVPVKTEQRDDLPDTVPTNGAIREIVR